MDDNKNLSTINTQKSEKSIASIKKTLYLCTCQTKGRAPAFGLTYTFDCVRGAVHVVTKNQVMDVVGTQVSQEQKVKS